jgi:hypothetical protein
VHTHQRLEEFPVVRHPQMQKLMRDHEILEARFLISQIFYLSNRELPESRAQLIAEVFAEIKNRRTPPKDTPSNTTIVRRAKLLRLIPSKP